MPISRECRVTTITSNIFLLSKYSRILFESFVGHFLNCWNSSLMSAHTGLTIAMWLIVLLSSITSLEVYINIFCTIIPPPHQVRGHYLLSLDLHDSINFQPVQIWWILSECQSGPYTAFSGGQFCFSWWTPMPEPFKHICGYIILYICVSGYQFIRKSSQLTNAVRMDDSIICLFLPTIAKLIHWNGTNISTLFHSSAPWSAATVLSSASWP